MDTTNIEYLLDEIHKVLIRIERNTKSIESLMPFNVEGMVKDPQGNKVQRDEGSGE